MYTMKVLKLEPSNRRRRVRYDFLELWRGQADEITRVVLVKQ